MSRLELTPAVFIEHLQSLLAELPAETQHIIALAGAPASGKTTLAAEAEAALNRQVPGACAVLPMDGFHYDDEVLVPRGWRPRKGAPHTFDVGGLRATLVRLRHNEEAAVAVPRFDRGLEIARAGAKLIERPVRLILVEGNYLLLKDPPWDALAPLFDTTALIRADEDTLAQRLTGRWQGYGLDEAAIREKLEDNDLPNGRLVYAGSREPDIVVLT